MQVHSSDAVFAKVFGFKEMTWLKLETAAGLQFAELQLVSDDFRLSLKMKFELVVRLCVIRIVALLHIAFS